MGIFLAAIYIIYTTEILPEIVPLSEKLFANKFVAEVTIPENSGFIE